MIASLKDLTDLLEEVKKILAKRNSESAKRILELASLQCIQSEISNARRVEGLELVEIKEIYGRSPKLFWSFVGAIASQLQATVFDLSEGQQ